MGGVTLFEPTSHGAFIDITFVTTVKAFSRVPPRKELSLAPYLYQRRSAVYLFRIPAKLCTPITFLVTAVCLSVRFKVVQICGKSSFSCDFDKIYGSNTFKRQIKSRKLGTVCLFLFFHDGKLYASTLVKIRPYC